MSASGSEDPIDRLKDLNSVDIQDAGALLLAAILTPIVTFTSEMANLIGALIGLIIDPGETLGTEVADFIESLIGGAADMLDAGWDAGTSAFQGGIWETLGPFAPAVAVIGIFAVTYIAALYFREEATADSILGLFSATDVPLIGTDEEE